MALIQMELDSLYQSGNNVFSKNSNLKDTSFTNNSFMSDHIVCINIMGYTNSQVTSDDWVSIGTVQKNVTTNSRGIIFGAGDANGGQILGRFSINANDNSVKIRATQNTTIAANSYIGLNTICYTNATS